MSELIDSPADPQDLVEEPEHALEEPEHVLEEVAQAPVVITEQAVAFSTAAAVGLPRTKPTHGVTAALRAKFHISDGPPPAQHHYLGRPEAFIEDAAMDREMYRL